MNFFGIFTSFILLMNYSVQVNVIHKKFQNIVSEIKIK